MSAKFNNRIENDDFRTGSDFRSGSDFRLRMPSVASVQGALYVNGGRRLEGEITLQGAKNSILPLMAATVLCGETCVLHNCPNLTDADAACRILGCLGFKTRRDGTSVTIHCGEIINTEVPDSLMREMRSSIVFLGSILGRAGHCRLSLPGGCELGPRPIDMHISALKKMGAEIHDEHGALVCEAPGGLRGTKISLRFASVGATENIILAAVLANGETEIQNAACEPEICDLADFLNKCGAVIHGAGTSTVIIQGKGGSNQVANNRALGSTRNLSDSVSEHGLCLRGAEHSAIPDRIAAATYLCAAAVTRGSLVLKNACAEHLSSFLPILEHIGCSVFVYEDGDNGDKIYINARHTLTSPEKIRTDIYPAFPTDAQAPLMALATTLNGATVFVETIFTNRFQHAAELSRLGAKIEIEGNVAVVQGQSDSRNGKPALYRNCLQGAEVYSTDLRGGAALVIAGLAAAGTTIVRNIYHIDRGYDNIEGVLRGIGADIKRV